MKLDNEFLYSNYKNIMY